MKIILIRPKPHKDTIGLQHVMICEPLELEYIAAVLEKKHEVNIYDMILEKKSLEEILNIEKPAMVIMSGYISHVGVIKEYAARIKNYSNKICVVAGGVHAEVVPEDFLCEAIDHIVAANGLKNIMLLTDGKEFPKIIYEEKEYSFQYPHPARDLVKRYKNKYYYMFHSPCALLKTSFGCPYNCEFCFCREITNGKYFTRDIDDVVLELSKIEEEEIYIVDDDFLFNEKRLTLFCDKLKEKNIHKKFLVYGRADFIAEHEPLIEKLGAVGLRAVIVGLESFTNSELDTYQKQSSIDKSKLAVSVLQKYDIECYGTFIIGIDWDKKDFKNMYKFIHALNIQFVNLQPITPMPHTKVYEQYESQIVVPREEFYKWDMAHLVMNPTKLSIRQFYFQIILLYYKITLDPKMSIRAIKKYSFWQCFSLTIGANRVMLQYLKKIITGKL